MRVLTCLTCRRSGCDASLVSCSLSPWRVKHWALLGGSPRSRGAQRSGQTLTALQARCRCPRSSSFDMPGEDLSITIDGALEADADATFSTSHNLKALASSQSQPGDIDAFVREPGIKREIGRHTRGCLLTLTCRQLVAPVDGDPASAIDKWRCGTTSPSRLKLACLTLSYHASNGAVEKGARPVSARAPSSSSRCS
jgi:hypothetical protein